MGSRSSRCTTRTLSIGIGALVAAARCGPAAAAEEGASQSPVLDQPAPAGDEALEKSLQNPAAWVMSFPVQYTTNLDVGPAERTQHQLELQPVIPFSLTRDMNVIMRTVIPILSNPDPSGSAGRVSGVGDTTLTGLFTRARRPGAVITAVGPVALLPTATNDALGSDKWGVGPALVIMSQPGHWSIGAFGTQFWSFTHDEGRPDVSRLQLQPIVSYRLGQGSSLGYAGIISADWEADGNQRWTLPIGAMVSHLVKPHGWVPMNLIAGGGVNAVRPDTAADWFLRLQVTFVLPEG